MERTTKLVSDEEIVEQRVAYTALLQTLGSASHAEIRAVLDEREDTDAERELSPEVIRRLRETLYPPKA